MIAFNYKIAYPFPYFLKRPVLAEVWLAYPRLNTHTYEYAQSL